MFYLRLKYCENLRNHARIFILNTIEMHPNTEHGMFSRALPIQLRVSLKQSFFQSEKDGAGINLSGEEKLPKASFHPEKQPPLSAAWHVIRRKFYRTVIRGQRDGRRRSEVHTGLLRQGDEAAGMSSDTLRLLLAWGRTNLSDWRLLFIPSLSHCFVSMFPWDRCREKKVITIWEVNFCSIDLCCGSALTSLCL